ncbi:hypothetical protein CHS0354_029538 [Potamilus streckersoni]|uniref:Uncharacterized protein n=1 Tax=Potamilus streckersoni TaxID=2493646 RepID=A0AAE0W578_9BIVA|nr:hypothetical protein CHS0354_029538 [Potamilus streckersoni]
MEMRALSPLVLRSFQFNSHVTVLVLPLNLPQPSLAHNSTGRGVVKVSEGGVQFGCYHVDIITLLEASATIRNGLEFTTWPYKIPM